MALEKLSAGTYKFYAPRFEIAIQNAALAADMSKAIISVSVDEKLNEGANFSITVNDEFDLSTQTFKWLDHPLFNLGNTVSVKFGYESSLELLMIGKITGITSSFFSGETPTVTVRGHDLSYDAIKRSSPEQAFENMTYSDIVKSIGSKAGLTVQADSTEKFAKQIRKTNEESYFTFIERLAREVGFQFKIDRQTLYFKKPEVDKKEILVMALGKDIISFNPDMNSTRVLSEVEVRGHNPQDPSTPIVGRATAGSEQSQESGKQTASQACPTVSKRIVSNVIVTSVNHANEIAKSYLNNASSSFIEGTVEGIGIPQIKPDVNIKLEKMGKRFSGKYHVLETTHTINDSGYKTSFKVSRNAV